MAETSSTENQNKSGSAPEAEELKPKTSATAEPGSGDSGSPVNNAKPASKLRKRGTYRPSHKATFIGIAVVAAILAVNALAVTFVLKHQSKSNNSLGDQKVEISSSALSKLGVNDTAVNDAGIELTVGPSARFSNNVTVSGNASIAGQLTLNSTFSATNANITQLQAGNTTLTGLNVNGNGTLSNLNVRSGLVVAGTTQFQGAVTAEQLFSVNNNLNVSGSLTVGGALSAGSFQISNLILYGHVMSAGSSPSISAGSVIGSEGTVSISGDDEAGTIAINAGTGASSGIVASITFRTPYTSTPHVIVSSIGYGLIVYVNRSDSGFSIGVSSLTPLSGGNGYAFDYIVEQ